MESERSKGRISYWSQRLRADGDIIDEGRKIEIFKALLRDYIGLSEKETEIFIHTSSPLVVVETLGEDDLIYLQAEKKVADFYGKGYEKEQDPNRKLFLIAFRAALDGFYNKIELDEMFSFLDQRSDTLAVNWLTGNEHPINRRIRNAYLPLITDVLEVRSDREVYEVDIFNNEKDPSDNMDEFLESLK